MAALAPRIVALAGSPRRGSPDRRLLRYAIAGVVEAGGQVAELGPAALELPSTTAISSILVRAVPAELGQIS